MKVPHLAIATMAVFSSMLMVPAITPAKDPEFRGYTGTSTTTLDCNTKAKKFPDIDLAFFTEGFSTGNGSENSIRCTTQVRDGGRGRKGVKVTLGGEIVTLDDLDNRVLPLPTRSKKTNRAGYAVIDFPLDDLPDNDLAVIIDGSFATGKKIDSARVDCTARNRMPCQEDATTACLMGDRFKVEVDISGRDGQRFDSSNKDAIFFFNNTDLLVELLNRCSDNDHFWVFASASTNVEYDLTVTDTATGEVRSFENELGGAAQAITDTSAFATCP